MVAGGEGAVEEAHASNAVMPGECAQADGKIKVVTVNVDGIGAYDRTPAERIKEILSMVLEEAPDLILMQEVVAEMMPVVNQVLSGWKTLRRRSVAEDYFNVTAVSPTLRAGAGRTSSYLFPCSSNGRHLLTTRPRGWSVINVHAESGRGQVSRDHREEQLRHMSRLHESEEGQACVLAGDFNMRSGEEQWLLREGWREVRRVGGDEWTWRRGPNSGRYDRIYVHGDAVDGGPVHRVTNV